MVVHIGKYIEHIDMHKNTHRHSCRQRHTHRLNSWWHPIDKEAIPVKRLKYLNSGAPYSQIDITNEIYRQ